MNAIDGIIRRLDTPRRESLSLKTVNRDLPNSDVERKKKEDKKWNRIFKNNGDNYKRCNMQIMGKSEVKERNRRNILSNNGNNFAKLMTETKTYIQEAQKHQERMPPPQKKNYT